jgi:hypothetical protein
VIGQVIEQIIGCIVFREPNQFERRMEEYFAVLDKSITYAVLIHQGFCQ